MNAFLLIKLSSIIEVPTPASTAKNGMAYPDNIITYVATPVKESEVVARTIPRNKATNQLTFRMNAPRIPHTSRTIWK